MTGALRTVSLRRRVTVVTIAVLTVVLAGVVLVVNGAFDHAAASSLDAVLLDRAQLGQQAARQGDGPQALLRRVNGREVNATLVLADGRTYGQLPQGRSVEQAQAEGAKVRRVRLLVPGQLNGAVLTLVADAPLLNNARTALLRVLLLTALGALVVTAAALVIAVRFALGPLDAMTTLARSISRGGRGRRLSPTRTDTELGRTAQAFDEMLDALEGAERQAQAAEHASKASEAHTRRFVADAAHELRTPIAGVQAVAERVLHLNADADPQERERLSLLLVQEARRASQLVHDLLDLARLDTGVQLHRERVDLQELAGRQVDRVRVQYPQLRVEMTGAAPEVFADPDRVLQILANVVDNACQASPQDGTVTIELSASAGFAEVLVRDTGPGVPPEHRERIFDRLVRLDDARDRRAGGSGLGLAIARGFARAHGGDLTCVSPPPGAGGAWFRLTLPADQDTIPLPIHQ
jgi:two-component system, OmpR family, sensor kinase